MTLIPANDLCTMVTRENIETLRQMDDSLSIEFDEATLKHYKVGETFDITFDYVVNKEENELIKDDVIVMSFILKIITTNGDEYWKYIYQPYVVSPNFLVLKYVYEAGVR